MGAAKNKGILTFIHNHPFTTSVLASCGDYNLFAKNKIKYGIVTNEFGMTIIKNKNIDINFDNSLTIKEIAWNIEKGIRADFNEFLLEKEGINPKDLSKNVYKKRFHEYARTKHDKYLEQYQTKLGQYFDITFIKP